MDLTGNTFWEFTDQINLGRLRRIVEYDKKAHYADVKLARTYFQPFLYFLILHFLTRSL